MSARAAPVGGPILTRFYLALGAVAAVGLAMMLWRLFVGLGPATAMTDAHPWGLWIAFDVVVGTALATGGYAMALLVYVLNRGHYHPLVRSAMLTSALGYSFGVIGVTLDLGRFWAVWKVPIFFWHWNLNSVLLEVGLCIALYVAVLWIEVSPSFLERWARGDPGPLQRLARRTLPPLKTAMPWLIALGLLLPTMHQSSLGSLMLLADQKLHPLWQTPLLPLLFLVSCLAMGFATVVMESTVSAAAFRRPNDTRLLASLGTTAALVIALYLGIRLLDIVLRGRVGYVLAGDFYSLLFTLEMALLLGAMTMLLARRYTANAGFLFRAAILIVLGGGLYRFSTFLTAYNYQAPSRYFPAIPETLITLGLVAMEIMVFVAVVKRFPILAGVTAAPGPEPRRAAWARASL